MFKALRDRSLTALLALIRNGESVNNALPITQSQGLVVFCHPLAIASRKDNVEDVDIVNALLDHGALIDAGGGCIPAPWTCVLVPC
jgi:hypothetical protein